MSYYQGNDNRRITGSVKAFNRGKRKFELGGHFTASSLAQKEVVAADAGRGGTVRLRLLKANMVNVVESGGASKRVKVDSIVRTPANLEYARRGIVTKGTIVRTELGEVRITSKPGRHGVLNGVLIKAAKAAETDT
ncbi:MAG: 30S ribosomal protein S8e [Thermoprotei archaeon]